MVNWSRLLAVGPGIRCENATSHGSLSTLPIASKSYCLGLIFFAILRTGSVHPRRLLGANTSCPSGIERVEAVSNKPCAAVKGKFVSIRNPVHIAMLRR